MARYHDRYAPAEYDHVGSPDYGFVDPRVDPRSLSALGPGYNDYGRDASRTSLTLVRPTGHHHHERDRSPVTVASTVIQEPVIEHEHHHLHHHIDHGDITAQQLAMNRAQRRGLQREYSFDDLDIRERRYHDGASVTTLSVNHEHTPRSERRTHRHRHRHRSRSGAVEQVTRYTHSDLNLSRSREDFGQYDDDEVTIIDVPTGTRRVSVNIEKGRSRSRGPGDYTDNIRRERGIRRSRGLGNELWTEITKDLITREAIEELDYQFEETDYFYYIFEYLDREQIQELRELTQDIRRERVRDLEYQSLSGSQHGGSQYGGERHIEDTRTEIIIESGLGVHSPRRVGRHYYH